MRETILSTCEKSFILLALSEGRRLDGRQLDDFRDVKISFGSDWGSCQVSLGQTKVLAQVSCEVMAPKATRPNEGLLHINVELSPMGAPSFEIGRASELAVQLNRLLEKCIKDSKCLDLESLCIVAEDKVWNLRVDIHVLNHKGSLIDAASIAALTALNHFRRPDVTMNGEQIVIHDTSERDPIPLTLHHQPVCITYAMFNTLEAVVADPTELEEKVSEAQIVLGMNSYRELCGVHLGGSALASDSTVWQCSIKAASRALYVVQIIKDALAHDTELRASGKYVGFAECVREPSILTLTQEQLSLCLDREMFRKRAKNMTGREIGVDRDEPMVVSLGGGSAELLPASQVEAKARPKTETVASRLDEMTIGEGGRSKWESHVSDSEGEDEDAEIKPTPHIDLDIDDGSNVEDDDDEDEITVIREVSFKEKLQNVENIDLLDSDEEETTVVTSSFSGAKNERAQGGPSRKKKQTHKEEGEEEENSATSRSWYPQQSPW